MNHRFSAASRRDPWPKLKTIMLKLLGKEICVVNFKLSSTDIEKDKWIRYFQIYKILAPAYFSAYLIHLAAFFHRIAFFHQAVFFHREAFWKEQRSSLSTLAQKSGYFKGKTPGFSANANTVNARPCSRANDFCKTQVLKPRFRKIKIIK